MIFAAYLLSNYGGKEEIRNYIHGPTGELAFNCSYFYAFMAIWPIAMA